MKNEKNIDSAIKYINLAIEDYDKFLVEIKKLPTEKQNEILNWLRNAIKYVDKKNKK